MAQGRVFGAGTRNKGRRTMRFRKRRRKSNNCLKSKSTILGSLSLRRSKLADPEAPGDLRKGGVAFQGRPRWRHLQKGCSFAVMHPGLLRWLLQKRSSSEELGMRAGRGQTGDSGESLPEVAHPFRAGSTQLDRGCGAAPHQCLECGGHREPPPLCKTL